MPIHNYEKLNHTELAGLPRDKTVVIVPTGPLEQHGPHLPFATDPMTAEFFSARMAEKLQSAKPDWHIILFPVVMAGCDTLTYTGTIEVSPSVLRALLYANCKQLAKDGFRTLIALSTHGGPRHAVVLDEVAAKVRWRHRARMISASGRILHDILTGGFVDKIAARMEKSGSPLTDAQREGLKHDYHGGLLETSIMLVARPDLVKPVYKELRPALVDSFWKLRRSSGLRVGEGLGHLGSPALASAELGKQAVEVLLDDTMPLVERFLNGENMYKQFRTKFYFIPFLRTDFKFIAAFGAMCLLMLVLLWVMNGYLVEMYK